MNKKLIIVIFFVMMKIVLVGVDQLYQSKLDILKNYTKRSDNLFVDQDFKNIVKDYFFKNPSCLRIIHNKIYCVDNLNHKIVIYSLGGSLIKIFGRSGRGPGDIYFPLKIVPYKNDIYLSNLNGIEHFDRKLNFKNRIKTFLTFRQFSIFNDFIYFYTHGYYKDSNPLVIKSNMQGKVVKSYSYTSRKDFPKEYFIGMILSNKSQFYYFCKHWNRVIIFDSRLKKQKEFAIKYDLLDKLEQWNDYYWGDHRKNYSKKGKIWPANIIKSVRFHKGNFYLLLDIPVLQILKVNCQGKLKNIFTNKEYFKIMRWCDFDVITQNGKIVFYVMGKSLTNDKDNMSDQIIYKVTL